MGIIGLMVLVVVFCTGLNMTGVKQEQLVESTKQEVEIVVIHDEVKQECYALPECFVEKELSRDEEGEE